MSCKPRFKYKRATVYWTDSAFVQGWYSDLENPGGLVECVTVGFVVHDSRTEIRLAQSTTEAGHVGEVMTIPKKMVQRIVWR